MRATEVRVTEKAITTTEWPSWEEACGAAVSESLDGATAVVIVGASGAQYGLCAWPVKEKP